MRNEQNGGHVVAEVDEQGQRTGRAIVLPGPDLWGAVDRLTHDECVRALRLLVAEANHDDSVRRSLVWAMSEACRDPSEAD